ncbi:hypothetical protein Q9L58_008103 [Maublancomyces gigas]|uniref:Uncharacterized protein n=1 Tax=Discina gigas TaxID=1032678 RepID=A0ABR3GBB5_9PEZI
MAAKAAIPTRTPPGPPPAKAPRQRAAYSSLRRLFLRYRHAFATSRVRNTLSGTDGRNRVVVPAILGTGSRGSNNTTCDSPALAVLAYLQLQQMDTSCEI